MCQPCSAKPIPFDSVSLLTPSLTHSHNCLHSFSRSVSLPYTLSNCNTPTFTPKLARSLTHSRTHTHKNNIRKPKLSHFFVHFFILNVEMYYCCNLFVVLGVSFLFVRYTERKQHTAAILASEALPLSAKQDSLHFYLKPFLGNKNVTNVYGVGRAGWGCVGRFELSEVMTMKTFCSFLQLCFNSFSSQNLLQAR